ncbi:hypothetical protein CBH50_005242 [Salmonella enterica subsp. diarizonae serovar 60:r:e,n,x,z15]|nr:hypothetical protein [Salmonella enterica subsp. diarizonae serovar 60:r:e,n,x,z15]
MVGWSDGRMVGWSDGRMVGWSDGRMAGKNVEKISNGVSSTGTKVRYANNKKTYLKIAPLKMP